jgi:subtilisin family serine protease
MLRVIAVGAIASVSVLAVDTVASADTSSDGLWYYSALHIQAAHDAGWTGKGVTIADIEGTVNTALPTLAGANVVVEPAPKCYTKAGKPEAFPSKSTSLSAWHASNVLSLLVGSGKGYAGQSGVKGIAPGAKVLVFPTSPSNPKITTGGTDLSCFNKAHVSIDTDNYAAAIVRAVDAGATIITSSIGIFPNPSYTKALAWAEKKGVVVLGALPDDLLDIMAGSDPATSNGVVAVQAIDSAAKAYNIDDRTKVSAPGVFVLTQGVPASRSWTSQRLSSGTSFATPIVAGMLALVKQKYPKATGNQLIQTLIHNTGTQSHALVYDATNGLGYGVASVTHMLTVDPTTYPNKNPLVSTKSGSSPSAKQIASATNPGKKSTSKANSSAAGAPGWLLPAIIGSVIALLVIVGVVIIVVVRRASARNRT